MIPLSKPLIGNEEKRLVNEVLDSGMLAQGPKVKELEEKFARLCHTKYAVAVNSGTAAIHTALYAAGIRKGDEVITTPFTFVATANPVLMQNAKLVFADINAETFTINPEEVKKAITSKTKAIISVDLYGLPADYDVLRDIAKEHNLVIIEDASQAHNAEFKGIKTGKLGDVAAFSFYATKNMMSGEGGIITTDSEKYSELCKRFRHHGQSEKTKYEYYDLGYNYRMTDLQAAIALAQLEKLDDFTKKRIAYAKKLSAGLSGLKGITIPKSPPGHKHVFHQYTIKCDNINVKRDDLLAFLKEKGIGAGVYYPKPLHLYPHFSKMGFKKGQFPVAESVAKQVLSLPVHPSLSEEDIDRIIKTIKEFVNKVI